MFCFCPGIVICGGFFHLPGEFVRLGDIVIAAREDAVHVVFFGGTGLVFQDMMVLVVLGGVEVLGLGLFIKDTGRRAVVLAVLFAAFRAEMAVFAFFEIKRLGAAAASVADPALADAALGAVVAVFRALAVVLEAFFADLAVLPALFALLAALAVVEIRADRAAPAILADVFTAVDAVLAFLGALTGFRVAGAAIRAVVSIVLGAFLADPAGLAKFYALAERAFTAFRAEEFLVAVLAVFAAVAGVDALHDRFEIALVQKIVQFGADRVDSAMRAHDIGISAILDALLAHQTLRGLDKLRAVFAFVAGNAVRNIAVIFRDTGVAAFRAVQFVLHGAGLTVAAVGTDVFAFLAEPASRAEILVPEPRVAVGTAEIVAVRVDVKRESRRHERDQHQECEQERRYLLFHNDILSPFIFIT